MDPDSNKVIGKRNNQTHTEDLIILRSFIIFAGCDVIVAVLKKKVYNY